MSFTYLLKFCRSVCPLLLVFVLLLACVDLAHAAVVPEPQPTVDTPGPSTGTLLAAALETAGYKSQSDVLIELKPMLLLLAALLYLGSALSAFTTITQGGKYEAAVWYFVGPSVFFFICASKTESAGAEWQFGVYKGKNADVQAALDNVDSAASEVSWLFDRYNRLISNINQQLIGLITNRDELDYLKFLSRARIMDEMFRANVEDPDMLAFAKFNLQNCGDQLESARRVALGNRDPQFRATPEYKTAEAYYKQTFRQRNIEIPTGIERDYVGSLLRAWNSGEGTGGVAGTEGLEVYSACLDDTKERMSSLGASEERGGDEVDELLRQGVSCQDMWCWMGLGIQQQAIQAANAAQAKFLPEDAGADVKQQVWEDIAQKLTTPSGWTDAQGRHFGGATPDLSVIPVIFSGYMTRKMMTQDLRSEFMGQFANHSGISSRPFNFSPDLDPEQNRQVVESRNQHNLAESKRYELYYFAMAIPYLQGGILYVLATTFPFFALMVIIPGQAGAFFQWMALWAWAKSWDLGFAVVMVVDDLLWSMMPHNSYYHELTDPLNSPITAFEAAFQGDPAYSLGNYYMIVSALLTSVPIVTAQAILGSKKAIAGSLVGGLKGLSAEMGGYVGDYTAHQQLAAGEYMRDNEAAKYGASRMNTDANIHNAQLGSLAKEMDASGQTWKTRGTLGGLAALGFGALGFVTGGFGWFAGATVLGVGSFGALNSGFKMTRGASGLDKNRKILNAQIHSFKYSGTKRFMRYDSDRAGITKRGEFWNVANDPASAFKEADVIYRASKASYANLTSSAWGTIASGVMQGMNSVRTGVSSAVQAVTSARGLGGGGRP